VRANRQLGRLQTIIMGADEASAIAAMKVAGALKVGSLEPPIRTLLNHENRNYAKTAMAALAAINPKSAQTHLKQLTTKKNPLDLRLIAVSQLAHLNTP